MRATTLVQASADIVTVISLKTGDVYKRLEKGYSNDYSIQLGIVQDVLHNGEDTAITALEFASSYTGVEPKIKVFGTDSDLKLFAATPEEIRSHFEELQESANRAIKLAEDDLAKKRELAARVELAVSHATQQALTTPATNALDV